MSSKSLRSLGTSLVIGAAGVFGISVAGSMTIGLPIGAAIAAVASGPIGITIAMGVMAVLAVACYVVAAKNDSARRKAKRKGLEEKVTEMEDKITKLNNTTQKLHNTIQELITANSEISQEKEQGSSNSATPKSVITWQASQKANQQERQTGKHALFQASTAPRPSDASKQDLTTTRPRSASK